MHDEDFQIVVVLGHLGGGGDDANTTHDQKSAIFVNFINILI